MDISGDKSTYHLLRKAIAIEQSAASIYYVFSLLFSEYEEVASFWTGLQRDEEFYANQIFKIISSLPNDELHSPADEELWNKIWLTKRVVGGNFLSMVKTLDDAYAAAIEIESSDINNVFNSLVDRFITPQERSKIIIRNNDYHQKKIKHFDDILGDKNFRKTILVRKE
jgi:hypothetical protein